MRRIVGWILICCMLLPLGLQVFATEQPDVEQVLIDSCIRNEKVDISRYKLTESQLEELYYTMLYAGKLPWYSTYEYTYYYNEQSGLVLEFEPILLGEDCDRMAYEEKIAQLLSCLGEELANWQKALILYDRLVLDSVYDESLERDTGYQLLVEGSSVCAGYAAVYQDLMLRLGIPCLQVDSEEMDHVWNLVQLDGKWYHVDVTWGDPTPDTYGRVDHSYFLRTDKEMKSGEDDHYGWQTDIVCDDGRFSDAFWLEVPSGIFFTDSDTCYFLREEECVNRLVRRSISSEKETTVYQEKAAYVDIGYGKYGYFHTGLTLRDGRLWLCDMDEVLSMDLKGKDRKTEFTYDVKGEKRYLMGCTVGTDTLYLTTGNHDGDGLPLEQPVTPAQAHTHRFTRTVTAATCTENGYTTSLCDCGLTATGTTAGALGHSWEETDSRSAGLFSDGYTDNTCATCGETEHLVEPKLELGQWVKENMVLIVALISIPISILIRTGRWKKD